MERGRQIVGTVHQPSSTFKEVLCVVCSGQNWLRSCEVVLVLQHDAYATVLFPAEESGVFGDLRCICARPNLNAICLWAYGHSSEISYALESDVIPHRLHLYIIPERAEKRSEGLK